MSVGHRVIYASARVQKEITKFLKRLPKDVQQWLYDAMKGLAANPRPQQTRQLGLGLEMYSYTAQYRLRVGDYRILYDVDDRAKTVVVLAIRRKSEKTYR